MIKRRVSTERFENIRYYIRNLNFKSTSTVVRSSTLFTFGYPNLMRSLLQYISFYFNINIATFIGFQIAVYAYVVLGARKSVDQFSRQIYNNIRIPASETSPPLPFPPARLSFETMKRRTWSKSRDNPITRQQSTS